MTQTISPITKFLDKVIDISILWMIPRFITPNHVTGLRLVAWPIAAYLLYMENYKWGIIVFSFLALTDAIDGALARTRNMITDWGRLFDPIADKLLISFSSLVVISKFDEMLAIAVAALEAAIGGASLYHLKTSKEIVNPHWTGKTKMVLQSLGVGFALVFLMTGIEEIELLAKGFMYFAIGLGLISTAVYKSA